MSASLIERILCSPWQWANKQTNKQTGLWLRIGAPKPSATPSGWEGDNLEWPDEIHKFLIPHFAAVDYLKQAYSTAPFQAQSSSEEMFARKRAEAYGRWLAAKGDEENQAWDTLHPLQSSLVYFAVACNDATPTGDLFLFPLKELDNSGIAPVVAVVASGYSNQLDNSPEGRAVILIEKINAAISASDLTQDKVRDYLRRDKTIDRLGKAKVLNYTDGKDNLKNQVQRCGESIFPVPGHGTRFELLFRWMALLIQRLRQTKHEGHPLDFWFVAGDASEFEDDPDIRMTKKFLSQTEASVFSPPQDGDLIKHLDKTCKLLEKEHFPWFSDGQHALFFDLSHKDMLASGLCSIRRSNWEFQLGELYKSTQEQEASLLFPACLIGFISSRHGGAGIAVCHPHVKGGKKLSLLARLGKNGWQSGRDQRVDALKEVVKSAYTGSHTLNTDSLESFAQLCQLIADNPRAGGTFVLLNNEDKREEFIRMGDPWNFGELTLSEQIPLVSHDGATLLFMKEGKPLYHHRYMLVPHSLHPDIQAKLAHVSKTHDSPLASVGTRRWSSAMAAFRDGVEAVIVISQDGDITCYRSPKSKTWGETTVQRMVSGKKPDKAKALNIYIKK